MGSVRQHKLTPKQELFCKEYLVDLNATQAAIRAGYSKKTASRIAIELLHKTHVSDRVTALQQKRAEKVEITADKIVSELAKMGFSNMMDYMKGNEWGDPYLDFASLTRDQAAALTEVTTETYFEGKGQEQREVKKVKFKLSDKRAALMDIAKLLGFSVDRQEMRVTSHFGVIKIPSKEPLPND